MPPPITTSGYITLEEVDGNPSIVRRKIRFPNGSLVDVDAATARYDPKFVQLLDVLFTTLAGRGGYTLQIKADASGIEAVAPYDFVSMNPLATIVENAGALQVELSVFPVTPPTIAINSSATNNTATNATNEWPNNQRRHKADLSRATQARLVVRAVAAWPVGAKLTAQFSTDESTWAALDNASGPQVAMDVNNATQVSAWVNLTAAAKADVFLRLMTSGGADATTGQTVGTIDLQFR